MPPEFLDTNIAVRYFTGDDPAKAEACRALFAEVADGTRVLRPIEAVFIEIVQVLTSKVTYNLSRRDTATKLTDLLSLRGIRIPYKQVYHRALAVWVATPQLSIVDCLLITHAEREKAPAVLTYDVEFRRVPTITRSEPAPAPPSAEGSIDEA